MADSTIESVKISHDVREQPHPKRKSQVGRRLLTIGSIVAVVAFVAVNRRDLGAFATSLRSASPAWILVSVVVACAGVTFGYAGSHRVAISASGVPVSFGVGVQLGFRAFAMNTLVKSGGLAGIVPYLRHAEQHNASRSRTRTGYLLANILGDVAVAVTLLLAIIVLSAANHLSRTIVAASAVFALYLLSVGATVVAAARSRESIRRLHALPARIINSIRRRHHVSSDHRSADEMHAAITQLRSRPLALAPAVGWALLVDATGVTTLLLVMKAFGQPAQLPVAVSAYAISMLFALVSFLPGGLGFAELSLAGVLVSFGVPVPIAAAIAVTDRVAETWIPSAIGLLVRTPRTARQAHVAPVNSRPRHRALHRNRRIIAGAVIGLGIVELWLAATRRPIIDASAIALDPQSGALRDSRYLLLACALALLIAAKGLARGSQRSWMVSLAAAAASVAVHPFGRGDLFGAFIGVVAVAALIVGRPAFRAKSDPASSRTAAVWMFGGALVVVAYGTVGLYLMDTEIAEGTTLWESFDSALRLLFVLPSTTLSPLTRHANWFIDSVRVLAVAVLTIGVTMLTRPALLQVRRRRSEQLQVATILQAHGGTSLAHFHLLRDKSYVFSPDALAFVGFRRVGAVAVALGGPVGPSDSAIEAGRAFMSYCDSNGWVPALHQVTEEGRAQLAPLGLHSLKIGEEAIIDFEHFSLDGGHFKRTRSQFRKLTADGVTVQVRQPPLTDETLTELQAVSDAWLKGSGHRERTFTLGSFDPSELRNDVVLVARSASRVEAFVNIIPSYTGLDGNFDLMRRRPDAPNAVMDLLLISLVERFRAEGRSGVSLGFAPLTNIDGRSLASRTLRSIAERDSKAFNFKGLRAYKEKWHPRWEPRFLLYTSELSLVRVGFAVARVGELRTLAPLFLRFGLTDVPGANPLDEARSSMFEAKHANAAPLLSGDDTHRS